MVQPGQWTVRLTSLAKADFRHIVAWTQRHFGEAEARRYAATLSDAILLTCYPEAGSLFHRIREEGPHEDTPAGQCYTQGS